MAHLNKVARSIETEDGGRCVDIFVRPDGSFGFEEYRRDVEDARGWFPIGGYAPQSYADEAAALEAASSKVAWLANRLRKS
jgi:hypothetical protein